MSSETMTSTDESRNGMRQPYDFQCASDIVLAEDENNDQREEEADASPSFG